MATNGMRPKALFRLLCASAVVAFAATAPAMAQCTDGDGDNYGVGPDCLGTDCDDSNADVNPGATEICNGIDDNCDGTIDEGQVLVPDSNVPVFGFETRGVCDGTAESCDLRFPEQAPPGCSCVGTAQRFNFNQVIQGCVDGNTITGPCDNGQPGEGFSVGDDCPNGGSCVPVPVGLGEPCILGAGTCRRLGTVVCSGGVAVCDAEVVSPSLLDEATPDPTSPLCFDFLDNDCDGLTDHEDPDCRTAELCDGFDNNFDGSIDEGFDLGSDCTVGLTGSPCENSGVLICNNSGGTTCSVNPNPKPQIVEVSCSDSIDNDCDGDVDCEDLDCITPEVCDGLDNDCDGQIDNGFDNLNQVCTVGIGACEASGVYVCNGDQTGTRCSANPLASSPERLSAGDSCTDGIDNDCDGLTDSQEPQCGTSSLAVTCELETICRGCSGWYGVEFEVSGATGETETKAELLALDENGLVIGSIEVQDGDAAKLSAFERARECPVIRSSGRTHEIQAPIPLLRITARDELGKAEAFCSNIPFVQVREPQGSVVSAAVGDEVRIVGAIPNTDPTTLKVLIDCVDIIPLLVGDPQTELPGGPFSGDVNINGQIVQVKNLIVDTKIGEQSSNTVSMTLVGTGCGGHTVRLEGENAPDVFPEPLPNWCWADDLLDNGSWSVFDLTVTKPAEGEIVSDGDMRPASINVQGDVCGGLDIEEVLINGFQATLPPPTVTQLPGGECAADTKKIELSFDEDVPVTDIAAVFAGTKSTRGSFDPGPNLLVGQATDVVGNTVHDLVPFVVGPAITNPLSQNNLAAVADGTIPKAFTLIIDDTVTLPNGNGAFREFFDVFIHEFALNLANCLLQPREFCCETELDMPWWTCNPDVTFCTSPSLTQTAQEFADTFVFSVIPQDGLVTIRVEIPTFRLNASAEGECCTGGCGFFCVARTRVNYDGFFDIPNIAFEIDIDEADILNQDGKFTLRFIPGDDENIAIGGAPEDAISTGCSLLSIGTILTGLACSNPITCLIFVLPRVIFNAGAKLLGFIAGQQGIDLCPFTTEVGGCDGMQDQSDDASLCRDDLDTDFSSMLEQTISAVEITPEGLAIAISAKITPTFTDGQTAPISGTMCTEAPLVQPGGPGAEDLRSLSVAIADDFWNQLLAGMVESGKFRASFTKVLDLGAYIPDCEDIKPSPGDPMFDIKNRRYARCIGTTECEEGDFQTVPVIGEVCSDCVDEFPYRTCGGDPNGQVCTLGSDCPGVCDRVCVGGSAAGDTCLVDLGCPGGTCDRVCVGGPTPGVACTLSNECREDCVGCATNEDTSCAQGACNRAARRALDKKIGRDTDIVLHARLESPPAFYLVDDPATEKVEVIFRTGEMRSVLIANRDENNDVGGFSLGDGTCDENEPCDPENKCDQGDLDQLDIDTVEDCSLESLPNNVDCVLWSTCLDLDVKFAIGVQNKLVEGKMRPELDFELIGIVEPPEGSIAEDQGDQCGGAVEIPDLDFLNSEALRNDARRGMERNFCEDTPPFQGCALDFDATVEFLNPALLAVSNCTDPLVCDTDFADYLVITGDLSATGLGTLVANKVCENLQAKLTENTGQCESSGDGGDMEREKICEGGPSQSCP